MTDQELVVLVNTVAFMVFWFLLTAGAIRTLARLLYYHQNRAVRPRLLNRDAVMIGGFALSFGLILVARFLGLGTQLRDSVAWAIVTDIPAIVAVATYAWFEYRVIERNDP